MGRINFSCLLGVFDTCLVCYLLVLPSETYAVANMTSLRAIDGNTSYHSRESFPLLKVNSPVDILNQLVALCVEHMALG